MLALNPTSSVVMKRASIVDWTMPQNLELVCKELNHLAAILNVYAGSLIFVKLKKNVFLKSGKYFYTFNHFYSEKSSKRAK